MYCFSSNACDIPCRPISIANSRISTSKLYISSDLIFEAYTMLITNITNIRNQFSEWAIIEE